MLLSGLPYVPHTDVIPLKFISHATIDRGYWEDPDDPHNNNFDKLTADSEYNLIQVAKHEAPATNAILSLKLSISRASSSDMTNRPYIILATGEAVKLVNKG